MSGTDTARFAGMDDAEWNQFGAAIKARREHLAMTMKQAAQVAGLSDTTWLTVESGGRVSARTARKAAMGLRWPGDAYDRIAAGEDPATFPDMPGTANGDPVIARIEALEATQRLLLEALGRLEDEVSRRPDE